LKLLITGISKLPPIKTNVYRGVKLDLKSEYLNKKGKRQIWWGFSSTTDRVEVLENEMFLGKKGERTLFIIDSISARDISKYSGITQERELILLPGTVLTIESVLDSGMNVIQLKEEIAPELEIIPGCLTGLNQVSTVNQTASTYPVPTVNQTVSTNPVPTVNQTDSTNPVPTVYQTDSTNPVSTVNQTVSTNPVPTVNQTASTYPVPTVNQTASTYPVPTVNQTVSTNPVPVNRTATNPVPTVNQTVSTNTVLRVPTNEVSWGKNFNCKGCQQAYEYSKKLTRANDREGYGYGDKTFLSTDYFGIMGKKFSKFILREQKTCPVCSAPIVWNK